jgi:hypothetical protein
MGPLWHEILENINRTIAENNDDNSVPFRPAAPKLAVFSAHDTTLIPLLASLDGLYDGKWPSYASMLLIEIHEINIDGRKNTQLYPSNFAFRLVYNGESLTHKLKLIGCSEEADLCDIQHLLDHLSKFATLERACARRHPVQKMAKAPFLQATEVLSSKTGLAAFLILMCTSAAAGALATLVYLNTNASPLLLLRRKYTVAPSAEDGIVAYSDDVPDDDDDDRSTSDEGFDQVGQRGSAEDAGLSIMVT